MGIRASGFDIGPAGPATPAHVRYQAVSEEGEQRDQRKQQGQKSVALPDSDNFAGKSGLRHRKLQTAGPVIGDRDGECVDVDRFTVPCGSNRVSETG